MRFLTLIIAMSLLIVACKKDKEEELPVTLNKTAITVNHETTDQLTLSRTVSCTWDTDDNYIASISNTGLVTGNKIGETKVHARLTSGEVLECSVKVDPLSMMYKEPVFVAGCSKALVKSQETRELMDEQGDFLVYEGENPKVSMVMYMFTNDVLASVIVLFETSDANFDEAVTFLDERYNFVEELNDVPDVEILLVYENRNHVVAGLSNHATLGLNVLYMESYYTKANIAEKFQTQIKKIKANHASL